MSLRPPIGRSGRAVIATLPERLQERTVALEIGARHSGHDFGEIEHAIEGEFVKRQLRYAPTLHRSVE